MPLQIIPSGGGNATADSISIPQVDLASFGVTVPEMTADDTGIARALWGFFKAVQSEDLSAALGVTKPALPPVSNVASLFDNRSYSLTTQKYIDFQNGSNGVIPLPTVDSNSGVGGFALTDIFPNAVKVAANDPVANAALLIQSADLTSIISTITHAGIDITSGQDNRELLATIYESLANELSVRNTSTASAFISLNRGSLSQVQTIPPAYIASNDPTSGLNRNNALNGQVGIFSKTTTLVIQTEDNLANESIDVRVVTA